MELLWVREELLWVVVGVHGAGGVALYPGGARKESVKKI